MKLEAKCPACKKTSAVMEDAQSCPDCQKKYPEHYLAGIFSSHINRKPLIVSILGPFIILPSLLFVVLGLVGSFVIPTGGKFAINGSPVSAEDFFSFGRLFLLPWGALGMILGIGLIKEKNWARYLAVTMTLIAPLGIFLMPKANGNAPNFLIYVQITQFLIFAGLVYWYFFKKKNVVRYFELKNKSSNESISPTF